MSLRRQYRVRRNRLTKAEFLAKLDEQRRTAGSFNQDTWVDASIYANESGAGGTYGEYLRKSRSVNRTIRRGDFHTTTPYHLEVVELNGSTMVGFQTSQKTPRGGYSAKRLRSFGDAATAWWGGYNVTVPLRQQLLDSSQKALLSKIRGMAPTWDILTSVAELRETLSSLKGAATWTSTLIKHVSLRDVPNIIRHLRLKSTPKSRRRISSYYDAGNGFGVYHRQADGTGIRVIDVFSKLWMDYRYAMMPIIYDMQDAMIALASPKRADGYQLSTQVTLRTSYFDDADYGWVNVFWRYDTMVQYHRRLNIAGSLRKRAKFSFYEDILNRLNPNTIISMVKTAWELVPYSWVADWFLDISGYLSLLELHNLISKSDICVTERGSVDFSLYLKGYKWNDPETPGYSGQTNLLFAPGNGVSTGRHFYFDRSIGTVSVPSWDPSESWYTWKRGLDTASLSWAKIKNSLTDVLDPRNFKH